jgi:hypothetical protein
MKTPFVLSARTAFLCSARHLPCSPSSREGVLEEVDAGVGVEEVGHSRVRGDSSALDSCFGRANVSSTMLPHNWKKPSGHDGPMADWIRERTQRDTDVWLRRATWRTFFKVGSSM